MQLFYEQVKEIPDIRIYGDFHRKTELLLVSLNLGEEEVRGKSATICQTEYGIDNPVPAVTVRLLMMGL